MSKPIVIHKVNGVSVMQTRAGSRTLNPVSAARPQYARPPAAASDGAGNIAGGWIVIAIASLLGIAGPVLWPLVGMLLLAGCVLGIVGMVKGRVLGGVGIIIGVFILPPLFWIVLAGAFLAL